MNASAASYFARSLFETAWAELMPPAARLPANSPIVATNHRTNTGQRWRALQSATRTVHGTPTGRGSAGDSGEAGDAGGWSVSSGACSALRGWESVMGSSVVCGRASRHAPQRVTRAALTSRRPG